MDRTIHELLEAKAAGDPLTVPEVERLKQHQQQSVRTLVELAGATPEEWAQFTEHLDTKSEQRVSQERLPTLPLRTFSRNPLDVRGFE